MASSQSARNTPQDNPRIMSPHNAHHSPQETLEMASSTHNTPRVLSRHNTPQMSPHHSSLRVPSHHGSPQMSNLPNVPTLPSQHGEPQVRSHHDSPQLSFQHGDRETSSLYENRQSSSLHDAIETTSQHDSPQMGSFHANHNIDRSTLHEPPTHETHYSHHLARTTNLHGQKCEATAVLLVNDNALYKSKKVDSTAMHFEQICLVPHTGVVSVDWEAILPNDGSSLTADLRVDGCRLFIEGPKAEVSLDGIKARFGSTIREVCTRFDGRFQKAQMQLCRLSDDVRREPISTVPVHDAVGSISLELYEVLGRGQTQARPGSTFHAQTGSNGGHRLPHLQDASSKGLSEPDIYTNLEPTRAMTPSEIDTTNAWLRSNRPSQPLAVFTWHYRLDTPAANAAMATPIAATATHVPSATASLVPARLSPSDPVAQTRSSPPDTLERARQDYDSRHGATGAAHLGLTPAPPPVRREPAQHPMSAPGLLSHGRNAISVPSSPLTPLPAHMGPIRNKVAPPILSSSPRLRGDRPRTTTPGRGRGRWVPELREAPRSQPTHPASAATGYTTEHLEASLTYEGYKAWRESRPRPASTRYGPVQRDIRVTALNMAQEVTRATQSRRDTGVHPAFDVGARPPSRRGPQSSASTPSDWARSFPSARREEVQRSRSRSPMREPLFARSEVTERQSPTTEPDEDIEDVDAEGDVDEEVQVAGVEETEAAVEVAEGETIEEVMEDVAEGEAAENGEIAE